jgi:hypothetical protein
VPADVLLQQHHVERRVALGQRERRPQPREPAADDRDVRIGVAGQGPRRLDRARLLQPPDPTDL